MPEESLSVILNSILVNKINNCIYHDISLGNISLFIAVLKAGLRFRIHETDYFKGKKKKNKPKNLQGKEQRSIGKKGNVMKTNMSLRVLLKYSLECVSILNMHSLMKFYAYIDLYSFPQIYVLKND